jgi:Sulfotransferase family
VTDWAARQERLLSLARRQIFLVGGAPRSGTTWLQYLLDAHPDISCRGEAHFAKHLAEPLQQAMAARRQAIAAKNETVFAEQGGYPLPGSDDAELLWGTAILLALERQCAAKPCSAVGEKTPENVFFFPRLKRLFPQAKLIVIARDPRDLLSSAWHFFHKKEPHEDEREAKLAFIRLAIPPLQEGANATLERLEQYPADTKLVTYECLSAATEAMAAELYRFLGVSDDAAIVADCVGRASFGALAGRPPGTAQDGSFFRKGVVGDWRATFSPEMHALIMDELGWMFPHFGWDA